MAEVVDGDRALILIKQPGIDLDEVWPVLERRVGRTFRWAMLVMCSHRDK
jgi:hypothetical protein